MVICLNNTVVILINIYGYSSHENYLLFDSIDGEILLWLNAYPNALVFIDGDFNIVPNNILDRLPPKQSSSTNSKLKIFMDKFDVIDIWREKFPNIKYYTCSNKSCSRQSHIDYWLVSQSVSILASPMTDHKATLIQSPLSLSDLCPVLFCSPCAFLAPVSPSMSIFGFSCSCLLH